MKQSAAHRLCAVLYAHGIPMIWNKFTSPSHFFSVFNTTTLSWLDFVVHVHTEELSKDLISVYNVIILSNIQIIYSVFALYDRFQVKKKILPSICRSDESNSKNVVVANSLSVTSRYVNDTLVGYDWSQFQTFCTLLRCNP